MDVTEFLRAWMVGYSREEAERAITELAAGGVSIAVLNGLIESVFRTNPDYWRQNPLFQKMLDFLPHNDDLLVAGIPTVVTALGALTGNKDLFRMGLGGTIYGGGMLIHEAIIENLPKYLPPIEVPEIPLKTQGNAFNVKTYSRYRITG